MSEENKSTLVEKKYEYEQQLKRQQSSPFMFWQSKPDQGEPKQSLNIQLTPTGFSIEGMKFSFSSMPKQLTNHLRLLLSMYFISQSGNGETQQSYFFKDINNVTYKLFLSGVENLSSVITQLQAGQCNTMDSNYVPDKLTQIAAWYDHGGTVPIYAATLARDASAATNELVLQCVSGLVKSAHDIWQKDATSGSNIGIILGVLGGAAIVAGTAAYCFLRWRKSRTTNNHDAADTESVPLKKI